ncbi:MAG: branched-chain amino acid aminotransferase [Gammaproteobacteria bacterium]|nr:branched-chain amino acid aminotransferase [Gammaproteobacteria bacterium]
MAQFGTVFCDNISITRFENGEWQEPAIEPLAPLPLHPAAHVFHYASSCFEGFKAYRWDDDGAHIFRLQDHVARMRRSAEAMCLPVPDTELLAGMVKSLVANEVAEIPLPPSALYLRPTLIGTLKNIGAAASPATEATLFILASPVGDYFEGGSRPLKLLVDDQHMRATEQMGSTKTGGNYASALGPIMQAKAKYGVDQVLFCPDGDVQETGAANFLLMSDNEVITKPLSNMFLHGVTRDSILKLAADLGYKISERDFTVDELLAAVPTYEATLSGTAACLTPVGCLVHNGKEILVRDGKPGPNTEKLRSALQEIHYGQAPDTHNWLTLV